VGQASGLPWANGRPAACPTFADLMLPLGKSVYNFVYSSIYMLYHRGFSKSVFFKGFLQYCFGGRMQMLANASIFVTGCYLESVASGKPSPSLWCWFSMSTNQTTTAGT
jgi:hypothetical protein